MRQHVPRTCKNIYIVASRTFSADAIAGLQAQASNKCGKKGNLMVLRFDSTASSWANLGQLAWSTY
ncbi:hypothetical protein SCLCIDRAFT_1213511 [Scleroderma citrinum Foug A]|uniref:Uncharacterized protein n=1 Tax=Scleroderma citrinum Foug A TaxID=1036808 RepID=A0A0C3E814_9AGAM|nr:hypothetical protein SCLCIDRAFT_1213511 [Scleroderma citrinum Foug A]